MPANQNIKIPLVSVFCPTYNHEKYIRQCLDGFVTQKTNFLIEVIVQDDASTDGTTAIVIEYSKKYDFIIPVLHKENMYSKGENINEYFFTNAKGKYLAICEGDDYWTDPHKLQKQVDFMESNLDYAICFHDISILKDGEIVDEFLINRTNKDFYTISDFIQGNFIYTPSVMYRHIPEAYELISLINKNLIGDYIAHIAHARFGKIKRINEKMAIYRYGSGIWSTHDQNHERNVIMFNTLKVSAYYINENHLFVESIYKLLIEKPQLLNYLDGIPTFEFEKYLSQIYKTETIARQVTFSDLTNVMMYKILKKLGLNGISNRKNNS